MHFTQSQEENWNLARASGLKMCVCVCEYLNTSWIKISPGFMRLLLGLNDFFSSEICIKPAKLSQKHAKADCKAAYATPHILRFLNVVIYLQLLVYAVRDFSVKSLSPLVWARGRVYVHNMCDIS